MLRIKPLILFIFSLCFSLFANASFLDELKQKDNGIKFDQAESRFLPADQAFNLNAEKLDENTVQFSWEMPKGYYLYRHAIGFESPKAKALGQPNLPEGKPKYDEYLGNYQIYQNEVKVTVPVKQIKEGPVNITANYQGCAASGYCYPPMQKQFTVSLQGASISDDLNEIPPPAGLTNEQDKVTALLNQHSFWLTVGAFLLFGLLLSFTPCVLPMVPIVTSIVLGKEGMTKLKAFSLSSIYVLAIAITYAVAGTLAGLAGSGIQTAFQTPWVLSLMAGLFVLLALAMFGFYELKLPQSIDNKLNNLSRSQHGGHLISAFVMGILSALIVSPCVTAPLVGALAYIGQTGDALLGGTALFFLGLGMGLPLIVVATLGASLLPKTGIWMETVKSLFGFLLLGLAIGMLARFLPGTVTLYLWALLLVGLGVFLNVFQAVQTTAQRVLQVPGYLAFMYAMLLIAGASLGNQDPLNPLQNLTLGQKSQPATSVPFKHVKTYADLTQALDEAKAQKKPALLEFSADWCLSCQIMKRTVLADPEVKSLLSQFHTLEADVTANDADDKALEQKLGVFAPPTFLFFDETGKEIRQLRIVAETDKETFIKHLKAILQQPSKDNS